MDKYKECDHIIAYVTCAAESRNGFCTAGKFEYLKKNFEIEEFEFLDYCPNCGTENKRVILGSGKESIIEKFIKTLNENDTIESINRKAKDVFIEYEKEKLIQSIKNAVDLFNKNTGLYVERIDFNGYKNEVIFDYIEKKPSKPKVYKNGKPIDFDDAIEILRKALNEEPKYYG